MIKKAHNQIATSFISNSAQYRGATNTLRCETAATVTPLMQAHVDERPIHQHFTTVRTPKDYQASTTVRESKQVSFHARDPSINILPVRTPKDYQARTKVRESKQESCSSFYLNLV